MAGDAEDGLPSLTRLLFLAGCQGSPIQSLSGRLSVAICESAALSSVIFGPPFLLSPSVTLARSGFTFSVESRSSSQALPRSWTAAGVALIVGPSLGLAPPPAHRPVWSEPYVRRLGGMMDIPGGVAIKTRAS